MYPASVKYRHSVQYLHELDLPRPMNRVSLAQRTVEVCNCKMMWSPRAARASRVIIKSDHFLRSEQVRKTLPSPAYIQRCHEGRAMLAQRAMHYRVLQHEV